MTYDDSADSVEQKLYDAIKKQDIDDLQLLLYEDCNINKLDSFGSKNFSSKRTLLHIACLSKNLPAVKLLLKFKADPNIKAFPSGNTPLHIASMWAQALIVDVLLENGADPVINNQKNKNPLQVIGKKYKLTDDNLMYDDDTILENKMETQILLLNAGGKRALNFQESINANIAEAEDGLAGLKLESNARIKYVEKAQKKKFTATHPYLFVKANRMKAWKAKNKCTVQEYLDKRYIKVKVPQWLDKKLDVVHIDLSRVQSFQLAIAKELLAKSGLVLKPENKPKLPKGVKAKKEKATKKKKGKKSTKLNNTLKNYLPDNY